MGGHREDDPDLELAGRYDFWAKLFFHHRAKLWAIGITLSGVGGAILTATLLAPRVAKLEQAVSILQSDVGTLKNSEATKMYILCTLLRKTDPLAVPEQCERRAWQSGTQQRATWDRLAAIVEAASNRPDEGEQ